MVRIEVLLKLPLAPPGKMARNTKDTGRLQEITGDQKEIEAS